MAAELESLVVKVDVDLSPLNAAFTELERFEKRVQALSREIPNTLGPAVSRVTVGQESQSETTMDRISLGATGASLALSLFLPQTLLLRIGVALAGAIIGALAPEVAKLIDGVESPDERVARLRREIESKELVLGVRENDARTSPNPSHSLLQFIEEDRADLAKLRAELAEAEAALVALQQPTGIELGAMTELAEAVQKLTGKLDPDLVLAMQNVNEMWPVFRDIALNNLEAIGQEVDRLNAKVGKLPLNGTGGGGLGNSGNTKPLPGKALGGPVYPGLAFMVGERGPEIFVPDRAGRILPNGFLGGGSAGGAGGVLPGDDFDALIAEIERFGESLDLALGDVPEELRAIAETLGGTFVDSLERGRGVMDSLQEAGRQAAGQLLHYLLQSEAVRGELGELADVIENVLNQALNGSIDSWEDLGRVALEVLQAIIEKMVEAPQAAEYRSNWLFRMCVDAPTRRLDNQIAVGPYR